MFLYSTWNYELKKWNGKIKSRNTYKTSICYTSGKETSNYRYINLDKIMWELPLIKKKRKIRDWKCNGVKIKGKITESFEWHNKIMIK